MTIVTKMAVRAASDVTNLCCWAAEGRQVPRGFATVGACEGASYIASEEKLSDVVPNCIARLPLPRSDAYKTP